MINFWILRCVLSSLWFWWWCEHARHYEYSPQNNAIIVFVGEGVIFGNGLPSTYTDR